MMIVCWHYWDSEALEHVHLPWTFDDPSCELMTVWKIKQKG